MGSLTPPTMPLIHSLLLSPSKPSLEPLFATLSSSAAPIRRSLRATSDPNKPPNLKRLTSRIVQLTRRRQLHQIFDEIEVARKRYEKLNTIVMNAVMEACVHCRDVDLALEVFEEMSKPDGCGVDSITYATLLKGLGEARRIDEAFQILESVEQGTAAGRPKLCAPLIYGLLNALVEAGDLRRASGLLARYGFLLREGGSPSILTYNMLMKGYISAGFPQAALDLLDKILRLGLEPDRLTYNTLIFACVKNGESDIAMQFFEEMKENAQKSCNDNFYPDVVTYTTLLKGFGNAKDLQTVQKIVLEMKSQTLFIDRTAYTAMVDALLNCGSTKGALCIFGEILKQACMHVDLRPKPHLYLSMMRTFAVQGDYGMVKNLHRRLWSDSSGTIPPAVQEEADHLLMEAALNNGQIDVAMDHLTNIIVRWKGIHWTSRGGMEEVNLAEKLTTIIDLFINKVALRIEAHLGLDKSILSPCLLPWVSPAEPIENIMLPFEAARALTGTLDLRKVVMRFFRDSVVPITDDWGSCIGLLHREDCFELNAPLSTMMRSPPPCVTTTTSISHVVDLVLEKRYKMVIVVKHSDLYGSTHGSRAVGIFTAQQLCNMVSCGSEVPGQNISVCRRLM